MRGIWVKIFNSPSFFLRPIFPFSPFRIVASLKNCPSPLHPRNSRENVNSPLRTVGELTSLKRVQPCHQCWNPSPKHRPSSYCVAPKSRGESVVWELMFPWNTELPSTAMGRSAERIPHQNTPSWSGGLILYPPPLNAVVPWSLPAVSRTSNCVQCGFKGGGQSWGCSSSCTLTESMHAATAPGAKGHPPDAA